MEGGFCLWVGVGLTNQIIQDKSLAPLWPVLTRELEHEAGLIPGSDEEGRFPQRLETVFEHLRYDEPENFGEPTMFRRYLSRLFTEACVDLLRTAHKTGTSGDLSPSGVREVACLGQLANPIVSFKVEPLSSVLLARPAGPIRLQPYSKNRPGEVFWHEPFESFQRIVYHPHGLITSDRVMTDRDYAEKDATLAFELAMHMTSGNIGQRCPWR